MKTAYAYTRVSTRRQAENGESLEVQEQQVKGYYEVFLRSQGFTWGEVYVDPGTTSKIPFRDRPAGVKILAAAQPGDTIIVSKLDRAFRNPKDCVLTMEYLKERQITVHFLDIKIDTSSKMGEFVIFIMSFMANWEKERILDRTKEAIQHIQEEGYILGVQRHYPPFGKKAVEKKPNRWILVDDPADWRRPWARFFLYLRHNRQAVKECIKLRFSSRPRKRASADDLAALCRHRGIAHPIDGEWTGKRIGHFMNEERAIQAREDFTYPVQDEPPAPPPARRRRATGSCFWDDRVVQSGESQQGQGVPVSQPTP